MDENQRKVTPPNSVFWSAVFAAGGIGIVAPLFYLGILKFTHHRPLGAATLALMSTVAFLLLLAVAWRLRIGRVVALAAVAVTAIGLAVTALVA